MLFLSFESAFADIVGELHLQENMFDPLFCSHTLIVLSHDPNTNQKNDGVINNNIKGN